MPEKVFGTAEKFSWTPEKVSRTPEKVFRTAEKASWTAEKVFRTPETVPGTEILKQGKKKPFSFPSSPANLWFDSPLR
jgi:hypothetical protein